RVCTIGQGRFIKETLPAYPARVKANPPGNSRRTSELRNPPVTTGPSDFLNSQSEEPWLVRNRLRRLQVLSGRRRMRSVAGSLAKRSQQSVVLLACDGQHRAMADFGRQMVLIP